MSLSLRTPLSGCPATLFQSSQMLSSPSAPSFSNNDRDHKEEEDAAATSSTKKDVVPAVDAAEDLDSLVTSSDAAAHTLLSVKSTINNTITDDVVIASKPDSALETAADKNIVTATVTVDSTTSANIDCADVVAAKHCLDDEEAVAVMDAVDSQKEDHSTTDAPIAITHHSTSFTTAAGVPILLMSGLDADTNDVIRHPFSSPRQQRDHNISAVVVVSSSLTTPSKSSQRHWYHNTTPSAPTKPAREVDCAQDDEADVAVSDRVVCIQLFATECHNDAEDKAEEDLPLAVATSTSVVGGSQKNQLTTARRELFPSIIAATIGSKRSRSEGEQTPPPQTPKNECTTSTPTPTDIAVNDNIQNSSLDSKYSFTTPTLLTLTYNNDTIILPTLTSHADATAANSTSGAADAREEAAEEDLPTPLLAPAPDDETDDNTIDDILVNPPSGFSVGGRPLDDDVKFIMSSSNETAAFVVVAKCPPTPHAALAQDVIEGLCGGADNDIVAVEDASLPLPKE